MASIKKNIALNTAYQLLLIITPFITAPYVSRVLGPDGVGIYSYTQSILSYFLLFAALGTASYGGREIARNRDNILQTSKLFWEIELLTVFTTLICLLIWGIVIVLGGQYSLYFLIMSINLLAVLFDISWFYSGIEQFQHIVVQNSLFKILGIVCIFLFVKEPQDLTLYVAIMCVSGLLSNLSMWVYLPKYIQKINWHDLKIFPHLKETLIYFVPTIATSVYTILDKTLIGMITQDNAQNGYYEQATKIINMAKTIAFVATNSVLSVRMSYLFTKDKKDEIKKGIDQNLSYICFMGIGIAFGLIGVAARFVPCFFGEGYDAVIGLLLIFSPIILIIGISNCLGSLYYTPAGLRALSAKFLIAGSIINLILNCILIPHFESSGAAIASVIAELVITILYIANCNGLVTLRQIWRNCWKRLISGGIMLLVIFPLNHFIKNDLIATVVEIPVGVITYVAALCLLQDSMILPIFKKALHKLIKHS